MPDKSIRIFIGTTFPGMVWIGKIAYHREEFFKLLVTMELGTIVKCDGYEFHSMFMNSCDTGRVDFLDRPGSNLLDNYEASLALYKGNDTMMAITADYGIAFPVPDRGS